MRDRPGSWAESSLGGKEPLHGFKQRINRVRFVVKMITQYQCRENMAAGDGKNGGIEIGMDGDVGSQ